MKLFPCLFAFAACLFFAAAAPASDAHPYLILREEMERTAAQRDAARRQLLEVQADTGPKIDALSQERLALQARLDELNRSLMESQAGAAAAAAALQRAEEEVRQRDARVEALRNLQRENQRAFAELLNQQRKETLRAQAAAADEKTALAQERSALAERRATLEREMENVDTRLREADAAREASARERDQFKQLNDRIRQELQDAKRSEALANAKVAALENRLNILREELEQQYRVRSELEQDREKLQAEVAAMQSRLNEMAENSVPRREMEALQSELGGARQQILELQDILRRSRNYPEITRDLVKAQRERDGMEARRKELAEKLAASEARVKQEQELGKNLARDNRQLQQKLQSGEDARKALENQLEKLRKDLEAAREAGVRAEELDSVRSVLGEMELDRDRLQQELREQRSSVDALTSQLNEEQTQGRARLLELQSELGVRVRELASAQSKIEQLTLRAARVQGLEAERQALLTRRDQTQKDMRVLAVHIHELRGQITEGRRSKAELDKTRLEADQLRRALESTQQKEAALRNTRAAMEEEMAELRRRLRHLEGANGN